MSRRSVTRAMCAPLVIAIATTVSSPASFIQTLPAKFAATSADVDQLRGGLNKRALESAVDVVRLREELVARMQVATDFISSGTGAALARIDAWMTSVSITVIAALPSAPTNNAPVAVNAPQGNPPPAAETATRPAAGLPALALAPSSPAPAIRIEIEQARNATPPQASTPPQTAAAPPEPSTPSPAQQERAPEVTASTPAPAEKTVLATLGLVESASAALAPVAAPPPPAETKIIPEAKLSPPPEVKAVPEVKPAPAVEVIALPAARPAPTAEVIPQAKPAPVAVAKAVPEAKPIASVETKLPRDEPRVMEIKAREEKAEEKQVFASLGLPAAAAGKPSVAAAQPVAKAAPEFKQSPAEPEISGADHASPIDPIQMTNVPMSSPLRIRALTRADIPPADKLASLAPSTASDARKLPPEEQRVAYDAPVVIDEPTSIGRRRWHEEAAKYQGLGSPEALLEALKHMGAGAKTLGLPASLWCADFMNLVLRKSGLDATGSRAALSYLKYGRKIDEPRVGAIAVFSRGSRSGHIGIVRGTDGNGNPIIVSGNHNHKVAEAVYPKSRVLAYVVPK